MNTMKYIGMRYQSNAPLIKIKHLNRFAKPQGIPRFDEITNQLRNDIQYRPRHKPHSLVPVPPKDLDKTATTAPVKYDWSSVAKDKWFKSLRRDGMKNQGHSSQVSINSKDPVQWNRMINRFRAKKDFEGARSVFMNMKNDDLPMNSYTYSAILSSYAGQANKLIRQKRGDSAYIPLENTFNEALSIYEEYLQSGLGFSSHVVTAMLSVCSKSGKSREALEIFEPFLKPSSLSKPSIIMYTGVIEACFRGGQPRQAFNLYDSALMQFRVLDPRLYIVMVRGCIQSRNTRKAYGFFNEMLVAGFIPSTYHFNVLLGCCSHSSEDFDLVWEFFEKMQGLDVPADEYTYRTLLRGCEKFKKFERATEIVDMIGKKMNSNMLSSFFNVVQSTYDTEKLILNPHTVLSKQDRALMCVNMILDWAKHKSQSDTISSDLVNSVLTFIVEGNCTDAIYSVLNLFKHSDCEMNSNTWMILAGIENTEVISNVVSYLKEIESVEFLNEMYSDLRRECIESLDRTKRAQVTDNLSIFFHALNNPTLEIEA